jgi:AraC family transcriptional regulator
MPLEPKMDTRMIDCAHNRIAVMQGNRLVPLIPTASASYNDQPWQGILLERHEVTAGEIPEHEHQEFCIHLQTEGNSPLEWWSERKHGIEKTSPGSLILLPPGTRDRLHWKGSSKRLLLSLAPSLLFSRSEEMLFEVPEFACKWAAKDSTLEKVIEEMGREAIRGWRLGGLYADLLGLSLISRLLSNHAVDEVRLPAHKGGLPIPRLRHVMDYITSNLESDLRLNSMALEVNLSPFHFAHAFRDSTGQTPYQYLLDQRIDLAKRMLKNTRLSVHEVGLRTGFAADTNFTRAFRQRTGSTPTGFRLLNTGPCR